MGTASAFAVGGLAEFSLTEDAQRSIVAQFSKLMASIEEMRVFQNNVIEGFRLGRDCREAVTLHQH